MQPEDGRLLAAEERPVLRHLARRRDRFGRRALTLLLLDRGERQLAAAGESGMSERQVRFWLREFRVRRLAIFPAALTAPIAGADDSAAAEADADTPAGEPPSGAERAETGAERPPGPPLSELSRGLVGRQVERLLAHETGTREGVDPEELHDMRVAVRRMRSLLRLTGGVFDRPTRRPLERGLRSLGRRLGAVRDLDVFGQAIEVYARSLPSDPGDGLAALAAAWEERRATARRRLLAFLDSSKYGGLVERLRRFAETPGAGALPPLRGDAARPSRVDHLLPLLILERWAAVQAYDGLVGPEAPLARLHRLRIAAKSLRYALEFFADRLGGEAQPRVAELRRLQDLLGEIQDAVFACELLRDYLVWGTWGAARGELPSEPLFAPAVADYLAVRQRDAARSVAGLPAVWEPIRAPAFRRQLLAALGDTENA